MKVSLSEPSLRWYGAVDVAYTDDFAHPWRIPYATSGLFHEGLRHAAANPAGVRLGFRTDSHTVEGAAWVPEGKAKFDLTVNGDLAGSVEVADSEPFRFDDLPGGDQVVELWMPPAPIAGLRELSIEDGASIEAYEDERPRWITYGSSITHCGGAESPVYTWPAVVARSAGFNHTNLGFGGQCHLDTMIATTIRDLPADYISMCVGINIMGAGSLNLRTFRSSVIGFIQIVREKHPETPFIVMSPIMNPPREATPNIVGMTLEIMREEIESAVALLREHGDVKLHYVNGIDIMGPAEMHLLPDELHPGPEGYKVMGERFYEFAAKPLFPNTVHI